LGIAPDFNKKLEYWNTGNFEILIGSLPNYWNIPGFQKMAVIFLGFFHSLKANAFQEDSIFISNKSRIKGSFANYVTQKNDFFENPPPTLSQIFQRKKNFVFGLSQILLPESFYVL